MNKKNEQNILNTMNVQIPGCPCRYGYCCAECVYMSRSDYDRYGNAWCGSYRKYYDPSGRTCSRFVPR